MMLTLEQLVKLTGGKVEKVNVFYQHLVNAMKAYKIDTPLRQCHFLTQILHESGNLRYVEEIASGDAYDTRVDLGNTPEKDGDGRKYKGRGLIQLTGMANYAALRKDFKVDFVRNPELLKEPKYACWSAAWYWDCKLYKRPITMNGHADLDNFFKITYFVNGGYNGLKDRIQKLFLAYKVFEIDNYEQRVNDKIDYIVRNLDITDPKRDRNVYKNWHKYSEIEAVRKTALGRDVTD